MVNPIPGSFGAGSGGDEEAGEAGPIFVSLIRRLFKMRVFRGNRIYTIGDSLEVRDIAGS